MRADNLIIFPNSHAPVIVSPVVVEPKKHIRIARRRGGDAIQVGDRVEVDCGYKHKQGFVSALGSILRGQQCYSVFCDDGIHRPVYAQYMRSLI